MRGWQIRKLREAGLDPYMRATWQEAQARLEAARQEMAACIVPGRIIAQPAQQSAPIIDAPAPKAPGGKVAKPCPYCGVEFKALHWHVDKCKMRPRKEATDAVA